MIFGPFERMVALRYLRARRQEGFVSVIAGFSLAGIALGVATLIIVMSVMNGFRAELLGRILGLNGHFTAYAAQSQVLEDFDQLAQRFRAVPGVVRVTPLVEGQVMATANSVARGALVRGFRPEDIKSRAIIANNIKAGSLAEFGDGEHVLVGTRFAQRYALQPGDALRLISPQSEPTAFGSVPRIKTYRVAGLFEIGMYEYVDELRPQLLRAAGRPLRLVDWQDSNAAFFNAVKVERNVMFLILTLIIVVAAFNIISGLIMLVKDKGRDIAILRTMGATRGMILRIFLLAGGSVGVIGTIAGFGLGLGFADNIEVIRGLLQGLTGTDLFSAEIYFLSRLPSRVEAADVATVVGMSLALSFLATLYPAWRAARLDPVEALRYE
jgi:lipoprotein-releasing system permease protein